MNRIRHSPLRSVVHLLVYQWVEKGILWFVALFLVFTFLMNLAFGFAYYSIGPLENLSFHNLPMVSSKPFWPCVEKSTLTFFGITNAEGTCEESLSPVHRILEFVQVIIALFVLAAVIAYFTSLIIKPKRLINFKSSLNFSRDANGQKRMILSFFSAPVGVSDLNVRIVARARVDSTTIANIVVFDQSPPQTILEPYVPIRLYCDLANLGIEVSSIDTSGWVKAIGYSGRTGNRLEVEEFHVHVSGSMSKIDQAVTGQKRYSINASEVFHGRFSSVVPNYELARSGNGWATRKPPPSLSHQFEKNKPPLPPYPKATYVFGYGSLVDPVSCARTLGRLGWTIDDFTVATLVGYRHIWNVAMDNANRIPGYKQYFSEGSKAPPDVLISYLNVIQSDPDKVIGVLFRVDENELEKLKMRERNYAAIDVTSKIVNRPEGCTVFTFIGTSEATERFESKSTVKPAIISQSYLALLETAYRNRGQKAWENFEENALLNLTLQIVDLSPKSIPD